MCTSHVFSLGLILILRRWVMSLIYAEFGPQPKIAHTQRSSDPARASCARSSQGHASTLVGRSWVAHSAQHTTHSATQRHTAPRSATQQAQERKHGRRHHRGMAVGGLWMGQGAHHGEHQAGINGFPRPLPNPFSGGPPASPAFCGPETRS